MWQASPPAAAPAEPDFDAWVAQHAAVERALNRTPERLAAARERLFYCAYQLERLILDTPSIEPSAIRAKARIVCWLMRMENSEAAAAMQEIQAFVEAQVGALIGDSAGAARPRGLGPRALRARKSP